MILDLDALIIDGCLFFVPIFSIYPIGTTRTDKQYDNLTASSQSISCKTIIRYAILYVSVYVYDQDAFTISIYFTIIVWVTETEEIL